MAKTVMFAQGGPKCLKTLACQAVVPWKLREQHFFGQPVYIKEQSWFSSVFNFHWTWVPRHSATDFLFWDFIDVKLMMPMVMSAWRQYVNGLMTSWQDCLSWLCYFVMVIVINPSFWRWHHSLLHPYRGTKCAEEWHKKLPFWADHPSSLQRQELPQPAWRPILWICLKISKPSQHRERDRCT